MAFPTLRDQYGHPPILTPAAMLEHRIEDLGHTIPPGIPKRIVMTYQPALLGAVQLFEETTPFEVGGYCGTIHGLDRTDGAVGVVGGFGIGAPAAVAVMEELIACGVDSVLSVGAAGGIVDGVTVGDLIVCDGAVRDEGTSHHYAPADDEALPDATLTAAMTRHFSARGLDHRVGPTWTTDGLFRETAQQVIHFAANGALTVDMEASALFVVGAHRDIAVAAAFCVSDVLSGGTWHAAFDDDRFRGNMWNLIDTAADVLASR